MNLMDDMHWMLLTLSDQVRGMIAVNAGSPQYQHGDCWVGSCIFRGEFNLFDTGSIRGSPVVSE